MAGFMRRAVVDIAVLGKKATSVTCLMTREQTVAGVQNADPDLQVRQRTPSSLNMSHKAVDFRQLTGCQGAHRNPIQRTTIPCQSSSVRVRSDKLDYMAGTVASQNRAQVELGQLHLRVGRSRPGAVIPEAPPKRTFSPKPVGSGGAEPFAGSSARQDSDARKTSLVPVGVHTAL